MVTITKKDLQTIITDPNGAQTLVEVADKLGQSLHRYLTTNQIRALFGEVRQIQAQWKSNPEIAKRRLILLKPKMRYRSKKEGEHAVEELVNVLEPALDIVVAEKDSEKVNDNFQHFVEFMEAILAYHKAYGGK